MLVLLAPASGLASPGASDAEVLASAEQAFASGVQLRDDTAKARPAFAEAAAGYDELWRRGVRTPALALNRARAHRLAGELPRGIAALNEGLAIARWSRPLQMELEDARSAVGYPLTGDLAAQCRPVPAATIGTRMSPLEAWLIAGACWLLACLGVARYLMTRANWWRGFAALWILALAVLGTLWQQDARQRARENATPVLVVTEDVVLRKGNSEAFPARLDPRLPGGVEVRELARRGGWVQVQLAGGVVGWLPADSLLSTAY